MQKTILVTGSTDGIGLEAAKTLVSWGHHVLIHGRNPTKLAEAERVIRELPGEGRVEGYVADLSVVANAESLATAVRDGHATLDVLINNAGVFRTPDMLTPDGLDVRFAVNTIAPFVLTQRLLPLMDTSGRVINVSSAAQAPVDLQAVAGRVQLSDAEAYAQSKLALTMWSRRMAMALAGEGPAVIAVNPGSLLGTKMVREGYGITGADVGIGADILARAALADEFSVASGLYYDNDAGQFAPPHPDALDPHKCQALVGAVEAVWAGAAE